MKELKLPSGATVQMRDAKSLRHKDRMKVYASQSDDQNQVMNAFALTDALIGVLVDTWSLDLLPPSVKPDNLGELEPADYDALRDFATDQMGVLFPNLEKTIENENDPKATTENLSD